MSDIDPTGSLAAARREQARIVGWMLVALAILIPVTMFLGGALLILKALPPQ